MTEREAIQKALAPLRASDTAVQEVLDMAEIQNKTSIRKSTRTLLIAAAVAVLLIGTALAAAISRIQLVRETVQTQGYGGQSQALILGFEPRGDGPIRLGVWELTAVPEGYELADRDYFLDDYWAYGGERWDNARGDSVGFEYQAADQRSGQIALFTSVIAEETEVSVGGSPGTHYRETDGSQLLLWTDEERGIGFILSATSAAVSYLAVAESVRETGETPASGEASAGQTG